MLPGWQAFPMLKILLPLAAGILLGSVMPSAPGFSLLIGLSILLFFFHFFSKQRVLRHLFGGVWIVWVFVFGWNYLHTRDSLWDARHWYHQGIQPDRNTRWEGEITQLKFTGKWQRATVQLTNVEQESTLTGIKGKMLVYLPGTPDVTSPAPGDRIIFSGMPYIIPAKMDPLGFDWRDYLRVRGVDYQIFVGDHNWKSQSPEGFSWRQTSYHYRRQFGEVLQLHIQDPAVSRLAQAVILGDRDELGESLNKAYQASGAVHILAVSGLHVGLVAGIVMFLLNFFGKGRRFYWIKAVIAVILIWGYIGLTGAADSAVRAGVLFSFLILGRTLQRHAETLNLLSAAVVVLLLVNPWMIYHVGFQLSVLAVAGILFFQPLIYRRWFPPNRVADYFWQLFTVTLAAQITTVMLSLFYFHYFPVYFVLSGIFVVPLAGMFLSLGVMVIALDFIVPLLSAWAAMILKVVGGLMNFMVGGIAGLPGATLDHLYPSVFWVVLLPLGIGLIMYALLYKLRRPFIAGVGVFVVGLILQAVGQFNLVSNSEWYVLQENRAETVLLFRQGKHYLAMPLDRDTSLREKVFWPGLGDIWMVTEDHDFNYGKLVKSGNQIIFGGDTIALLGLAPGQFVVAEGEPPTGPGDWTGGTMLLSPKLDWKQRKAWTNWGSNKEVALYDMRAKGYWQRKMALD